MHRPAQRLTAALLFFLAPFAQSQTGPKPTRCLGNAAGAARHPSLRLAKKSPLDLTAFLANMPKGGDLHMHLSGAIYAETFIRQAVADTLCYSPATRSLFNPPRQRAAFRPSLSAEKGTAAPKTPSKTRSSTTRLSTTSPCAALSPQPASADTTSSSQPSLAFRLFVSRTLSEWLDEVATRAAAQNEQYLEVMHTPDFSSAAKLGYSIPWPSTPADPAMNRTGDATGTTRADLAKLRDQLLAGGLRESSHRSQGVQRRARRSQQDRELRHARSHPRLFRQDSFPLPGSSRLPPAAGLRSNTTRL